MSNIAGYLDKFEEELVDDGLAKSSIRAYRNDLKFIQKLFPDVTLYELTGDDVKAAMKKVTALPGRGSMYDPPTSGEGKKAPKQYSKHAKARKIQALRRFFNWTCKKHLTRGNFLDELKSQKLPKPEEGAFPAMSRATVERIIQHHFDKYDALVNNAKREIDTKKRYSTPDQKEIGNLAEKLKKLENERDDGNLVLRFLYSTMCRVGELIRVRAMDVTYNVEEMSWMVRLYGKGSKYREVPVDEDTAAMVQLRLKHHGIDPASDKFVFRALSGQSHNNATAIEKMIQDIREEMSLKYPLTPHKFRGTAATHMSEDGMPFEVLQKGLGHGNPKSTLYYVKTSEQRLVRDYKQHHPFAKNANVSTAVVKKRCLQCNGELRENANFCDNCGQKVN